MKSKKTYNVQSQVRSALRKLWLWSPMHRDAKTNARVRRGLYLCAECKALTPAGQIAVDHVKPVTPVTGFDSWDKFIERLFCPASQLNVLCKVCHAEKTKTENTARKDHRSLGRVRKP